MLTYYRNRELKPRWNDEVPQETIDRLKQVPYFRLAASEDVCDIEQFHGIPSLLENETKFVGSTREMIEYMGAFL